MADVIYREQPFWLSQRAALAVSAASLVAGAVGFFFSAAVFVVGLLGTVVGIALVGAARYGRITLTGERLTVGRDRLAVADIDPEFGVVRAADVLDESTLASVELGWSARRGSVRVFGGAYGRPKNGSTWLALRPRASDEIWVLATRRPDELEPLLTREVYRLSR